ncbi:MAG: hypothetical protein ACK2UB_09900 [Anaerolineales bacterium]
MANEFKQAVEKIKKGDEAAGRSLLQAYLQKKPFDVNAWLWMATIADTASERIACLKRVLRIDPNNATARKALDKMSQPSSRPPESAPAGRPAPRQTVLPPVRRKSTGGDWMSAISGFLALVALGVIALVADYYYNFTAQAYLREGRRTTATLTEAVSYWRRGGVMYCKVNYRFADRGVIYENEDTENDLDACAQIEAAGAVEIEFLDSYPAKNRLPWEYPEDYQFMHFGWFCAGPAFIGALLLLIRAMVPKKTG